MDGEDLSRLIGKHRVPGAQLVVRRNGRVVTLEAGEERYGSGRTVTARSVFPLGSLTKPFTAALAMTLVADGDLDLDDPLPGLGGQVTLRRLLSHTSGLPSNVDDEASGSRSRWASRYRRDSRPDYPPGAVFSYSNIGYLLVGHLVEEVTGMDWAEALEAIVLRPLGIPMVAETVSGHTGRDRLVPVEEQIMPELEAPNGALALSATDLIGFLDAEVTGAMCSDQLAGIETGPYGMADSWGLGWALYRTPGADWFGHDGTGDGTSCHLRFEPVSGTAVALTTNAAAGPALWADVVAELDLPLNRSSTEPRVPGPAECAGVYVNGTSEYVIAADGDQLVLAHGGPLTCYPGLRFDIRDQAGTAYGGRFVREAGSGRVELLQLTGRLARRREGERTW